MSPLKAVTEWGQSKFESKYDDKKIREMGNEGKFPRNLYKECCDLGYLGVWIPEEYGGGGLGILDRVLVAEALGSVDPFFALVGVGQFGSETIYLFGTEEQKEKWLTQAATGEAVFAAGITEPEAGTNVGGINTKAELEGDEWVINGTKEFNSNAGHADYNVVVCNTDPDEESPYNRQSMILVSY